MNQPTAIMMTNASNANIMNCPIAAPKPKELANQAKPKPAAKPPNMAPQGRLGAAGGATGAAGAAGFATELAAPCAGATGAAERWVTLLDCCPNDFPPPMRLAASAWPAIKVKHMVTTQNHFFILSPSFFNCLKRQIHHALST
jgi:hypothetical protein